MDDISLVSRAGLWGALALIAFGASVAAVDHGFAVHMAICAGAGLLMAFLSLHRIGVAPAERRAMNGLALLIPIALALGLSALAAFFWAARSGQFDDLDGAALRILIDEQPTAPAEPEE